MEVRGSQRYRIFPEKFSWLFCLQVLSSSQGHLQHPPQHPYLFTSTSPCQCLTSAHPILSSPIQAFFSSKSALKSGGFVYLLWLTCHCHFSALHATKQGGSLSSASTGSPLPRAVLVCSQYFWATVWRTENTEAAGMQLGIKEGQETGTGTETFLLTLQLLCQPLGSSLGCTAPLFV